MDNSMRAATKLIRADRSVICRLSFGIWLRQRTLEQVAHLFISYAEFVILSTTSSEQDVERLFDFLFFHGGQR